MPDEACNRHQRPHFRPPQEFRYKNIIIGHIDPFDVPFVALSLAVENDGIWSNDKHFENLKDVKVWKTADLCEVIGKDKML